MFGLREANLSKAKLSGDEKTNCKLLTTKLTKSPTKEKGSLMIKVKSSDKALPSYCELMLEDMELFKKLVR